MEECPANIEHVDIILNLKRYKALTLGQLPPAAADATNKIKVNGNPWGIAQDDRFNWAEGLEIPVIEQGKKVGLVTNARDAADRVQQEGWDRDVIRSRALARERAEMRDASDRLRPLIVETRRGAEQLMRILETLARAELTDGLTFAQLIGETTSRLPRDASVVAFLTSVTSETAIALGNLRRRGFAVTASLNVYESYEFAEASGPLLAEGVETRHLKNEAQIPTVCQHHVMR